MCHSAEAELDAGCNWPTIYAAMLAAAPAAPAPVPLTIGPELFKFDSFAGWVNHAQRAWKMRNLRSDYTLCIDAAGRICRIGRDFMKGPRRKKVPCQGLPCARRHGRRHRSQQGSAQWTVITAATGEPCADSSFAGLAGGYL
jgi:hypothetical protein